MHDHDHNCSCGNHTPEAGTADTPEKPGTVNEVWDDTKDVEYPEPTLMGLISSFASQTMVSLGLMPNPFTGESTIMLNQGKHMIDTIAMLYEKTAASQTDDEKQKIDSLLHELRMIFLAAQDEKKRRDESGQ